MKKLHVTKLLLFPRISFKIKQTLKEHEELIDVEETEIPMSLLQAKINRLLVEILNNFLLQEIESAVLKLNSTVPKDIFTIEHCISQSLYFSLSQSLGKDISNLGSKVFQYLDDAGAIIRLINELLQSDGVSFY